MWGRKNIIELLLKRNADVEALDETGKSVLSRAAFNDNPDISNVDYNTILQLLLSNGAVIGNHKDQLRGAILHGDVDTLRLFYRHGLKLEELCKWEVSEKPPLHLAASNKDVNVLKYLLNSHLFDVNAQDSKSGATALHVAIENEFFAHTQVLIKFCADPDLRMLTKETFIGKALGKTSVDLSVEKKLEKFVELLLFARADLSAHAKKFLQDTPLAQRLSGLLGKNWNRTTYQHQMKYTALMSILCDGFSLSGKYSVPKFLSQNKYFSHVFYRKCIAEIKTMQGTILQDQITFFDIFPSKGFTQCVRQSRDIGLIDDRILGDCFPIYGSQIQYRLCEIFHARWLANQVIRGLSVILRRNLEPYHLITQKILLRLSPRDLQNLRIIAAYEHR
ncbi:hypothetical protein QAD02_005647 [Eretmocerus hayati]|uniref:Uncharacterized protein n=1 Tax=Eretmocerus hayati TaxID=131215 RepID=A0ACC2NXX2_9HYME|nr:hypothetical protein QAD02_005647 [Eretmocerus hayati]